MNSIFDTILLSKNCVCVCLSMCVYDFLFLSTTPLICIQNDSHENVSIYSYHAAAHTKKDFYSYDLEQSFRFTFVTICLASYLQAISDLKNCIGSICMAQFQHSIAFVTKMATKTATAAAVVVMIPANQPTSKAASQRDVTVQQEKKTDPISNTA